MTEPGSAGSEQPAEGSGDAGWRDVVVVGGGPAGLSAALVLGRARRSVLVIDDGEPRNAVADHVGGYLGVEGIAPLELLRIGREQVRRYGVEVRDGRVIDACRAETGSGFTVTVEDGSTFHARKLLLCTGVQDRLPEVDGMRRYYGRGVHHCPYCDGWDHRDGRLAAYGEPVESLRLALSLLTWSDRVTLLTDGRPLDDRLRERAERNGLDVRDGQVARLEGENASDGVLRRVVFEDGVEIEVDAVFFSTDHVQHSRLPELLGCVLDRHDEVEVEGHQGTGVEGLFLAGDASGDVQFAIIAAAEGARAAVYVNRELQSEERP